MLREVEGLIDQEANEEGSSHPVVSMVFRHDLSADQRRYNTLNANEIAMVFVNEDGEPPFKHDIRVYPKNPIDSQQPLVSSSILSPNLDPMTYRIRCYSHSVSQAGRKTCNLMCMMVFKEIGSKTKSQCFNSQLQKQQSEINSIQ